MIFLERLRDFFCESLHDFLWRGCMIFLVDSLCDFWFFERLRDFVCGEVA